MRWVSTARWKPTGSLTTEIVSRLGVVGADGCGALDCPVVGAAGAELQATTSISGMASRLRKLRSIDFVPPPPLPGGRYGSGKRRGLCGSILSAPHGVKSPPA